MKSTSKEVKVAGKQIVVKYVQFGNVDIGKQYTGYHGVPNMPYKNH